MEGTQTKHPVVDHLKPISSPEEVGTAPNELGTSKGVHEPPYTIDELMGDMTEVTRETLAKEAHESPSTPTGPKTFDITKNTGLPTTPLVNNTRKLDISSSYTLPT